MVLDITKPDTTGLSDHERAQLDFLKWLDQPHDRPPFDWLSEFDKYSLPFWREASSLLSDLAHRAHEIRLEKETPSVSAVISTIR